MRISRPFVGGIPRLLLWVASVCLVAGVAGADDLPMRRASEQPPRKVIVGTVMQAFWVKYPGVDKRLQELTAIVDRMQDDSQKEYGRGLDLAVLPEIAVTGEAGGPVANSSLPFVGAVQDTFAREARKHHCYIVVPMYLLEDKATKLCSNVGILVGRSGETVGIYRKLHIAVSTGSDSFENGVTPGKEVPVFNCDFGRLGIQICFDIVFDYGWAELARKGAELVAWPTQSPETVWPACRAKQGRYYIVSSTWRNNASIFEPTGKIVSQVKWDEKQSQVEGGEVKTPAHNILVQKIDLSYAIVPWSPTLKNGRALTQAYGHRVGYRYYEDEDRGLFWSNDPRVTIRDMLRKLGLAEEDEEIQRIKKLYHNAGVPGY